MHSTVRMSSGSQPEPAASPGGRAERFIRPAAWAFYIVIEFEIIFMISPFALHFYAAYAPVLDVLHRRPGTAWLTKFYLPHFTETASPVLNGAHVAGFVRFTQPYSGDRLSCREVIRFFGIELDWPTAAQAA